jgi:hypothetical protein
VTLAVTNNRRKHSAKAFLIVAAVKVLYLTEFTQFIFRLLFNDAVSMRLMSLAIRWLMTMEVLLQL